MTRLRRAPKRRTPTCSTTMSSASMLAANSCERARSGVRNGWAARTAVVARLTGTSAHQLAHGALPVSLSNAVVSQRLQQIVGSILDITCPGAYACPIRANNFYRGTPMNRSELVASVVSNTGFRKTDAEKAL